MRILLNAILITICCGVWCPYSECTSNDLYKNARLGARIVQTRYGRLQGLILPLENYKFLKPMEAFLGVPYATPPTKSNRFSPTRTPSPWDGIRISDKYSPVCPQRLPNISNETAALEKMPRGRLEYLKRLLPFLQNQSEDCLYLNVFAPVHATTAEKKLPVIVFLHGESFEWNSGNPYDGTVLASYGEMVVITLNYRLGILGFLNANPSPQLRARVANYGLMDQMAALHWVQQNIAKFGGDPTMVTLAGSGTGAACINFLMNSPTMVPGLFHRAILLSGSAYSSWAIIEDPVVYALRLAREFNCTIPEDMIKHHEQIVDCLRDIPLEDLHSVDIQSPNFLSAFGPSVDGVVIRTGLINQDSDDVPRSQSKRSADGGSGGGGGKGGKYDLLFSVVTAEALWRFGNNDITNGFEGERRDKILRTYVRNAYTFHLSEIFYTVVNEYTDWERTSQHPINTRDSAVAALSDAQYVAPVVHTGDTLAGAPQSRGQEKESSVKCFFSVFDYQTKDGDYPQRMGTVHGEDLPYIFGAPLVDGFSHFPSNYTKSELSLSESIIIFWSNFARTGNPNEHHRQDATLAASKERNRFKGIVWDEYDPVHQKYLEIGMKPRMKNHFRAHQLSIWLRLIPELHRAGMEDVIARHNLFKNHDDLDLYEGPVKPDSIQKLTYLEETLKRRAGNATDLLGMTTVEPMQVTCIAIATNGSSNGAIPTSAAGAAVASSHSGNSSSPGDATGFEAGYAAYSTALSVTIAIGCSLLILNVLIFAGVYYQRDKTRLEVKSLQKQYQQRGGAGPLGGGVGGGMQGMTMHQQLSYDPIKHAHYHLGHPQNSNVIVDVEDHHDTGALLLTTTDLKSPHICANAMQINTGGGGQVQGGQQKMPLGDQAPTSGKTVSLPPSVLKNSNHQQQQSMNSNIPGGGGPNNNNNNSGSFISRQQQQAGMMTLPKSLHQHIGGGQQHQSFQQPQPQVTYRDCNVTLPRNMHGSSTGHNSSNLNLNNNEAQQQKKFQPNGSILTGTGVAVTSNSTTLPRGAPRPPIRNSSNLMSSSNAAHGTSSPSGSVNSQNQTVSISAAMAHLQLSSHHNQYPRQTSDGIPSPTPPPGLPFDSLQQQLYNQQTLHHPHTILKNKNNNNSTNPSSTTGSAVAGPGQQVPHAAISEMRV